MGGDGGYEFATVGVDQAGNREPLPTGPDGKPTGDLVAVVTIATGAPVLVIDSDTELAEGSFDGSSVRVDGAVLTLAGAHELANVELLNGAVLTHRAATDTDDAVAIELTAWTIAVDASSRIDVVGRGYRGGRGFSEGGLTVGNQAGATSYAGGSFGGIGGRYSDGDTPNAVYGDLTFPTDLGSGGGAAGNSDGGDGGGRVHIVASDEVVIDRAVRADGGQGAASASGEGAGGSVLIETARMAGVGTISANGGGRTINNAGGGGGRIAIYADYVDTEADLGGLSNISAWRGRGFYDNPPGSAGAVYLEIGGIGELIVDDNESDRTSPSGTPLPLIGPGITAAAGTDRLTTDGAFALLPDGLVGPRLNPDASQDEDFEIVANGEDSITVATPNEQGVAFADQAGAGKTYMGAYRYDNLRFGRGGHLEVGDRLAVDGVLEIVEYGLLTHPETTRSYDAVLDLSVGTLSLDADGRIDVTARGYEGGRGFNEAGLTVGNQPGASAYAGGSYGGLGGRYSSSNTPNVVYGDPLDPMELGSGRGAAGNSDGGDGGGRIAIQFSLDMTLPEANVQALGGDGYYGEDGGDGSLCINGVCQ